MENFHTIDTQVHSGAIGVITLNRPEKRNALSILMRREISFCLAKWRDDDQVASVVIMQRIGDPLETIWKNCIFALCGVTNFHRRMFGIMVTSSEKQRIEWLDEVRETVDSYFPVAGK